MAAQLAMGGGTVGAASNFVGLRGLRALQPGPVVAAMPTGTVVVVGVTDRSSLTGSDRVLIDSHSSTVQFAAVSVRPRYIGDCAAAGWATLGGVAERA